MGTHGLLRRFIIGAAAASFVMAGSVWAQSGNNSSQSGNSSMQLAGATARLDKALNTQNATQGEAVEAKLQGKVKTADGVELPGGTELSGTVSAVQASANGGPSRISVRFDEAKLKDGKTVPVKVIVTGAYPSSENQMATYGEENMGSAPRWVRGEKYDQEAGILSHIAMTSRVSGHNSATFSDSKGDVKLKAGTYLQVGISPRGNGGMSAGM